VCDHARARRLSSAVTVPARKILSRSPPPPRSATAPAPCRSAPSRTTARGARSQPAISTILADRDHSSDDDSFDSRSRALTRDAISTTMAMKTHRNIFYTRVRARASMNARRPARGEEENDHSSSTDNPKQTLLSPQRLLQEWCFPQHRPGGHGRLDQHV